MKILTAILMTIGILLMAAITMNAQTANYKPSLDLDPTHKSETNDYIIIKGKLVDALSKKSIMNAIAEFKNMDRDFVKGGVDEAGNYYIAFRKTALNKTKKIVLKLEGYKTQIITKLKSQASTFFADIQLIPDSKKETAQGN